MTKANWVLDKVHSNVDFSVRHMMVSRVRGAFKEFDARIEADPQDLTTANITFTIDVASIDTQNNDRDEHLRSADFFEVETYPELTFTSKKITKKSGDDYLITGDVTMHGQTKEETFELTFEGLAKDPMSGQEKIGLSAEGKLNRADYGLTWNAALETGGVLVSEEVKISLNLQAAKAE